MRPSSASPISLLLNVSVICLCMAVTSCFLYIEDDDVSSASHCPEDATECVFYLEVDYQLTMMRKGDLVVGKGGHLYKYDEKNLTPENRIPPSDVITGDGYPEPRLLMAFNGTIPGPALHVRYGQKVKLIVTNKMMHESTTVHVHGQNQRGSPHSDGVPFVTQCPILPGQTFVQNFIADPEGTYFYHSHSGPQMTMGLYGAFIVHPRTNGAYKPQTEDGEHILIFQDWNHNWDSNMITMKMRWGMYERGVRLDHAKNLANVLYRVNVIIFIDSNTQSGIINGKGRFNYGDKSGQTETPLTEFRVEQGKRYRLRLINAGDVQPFRVSVDRHTLSVVATDGFSIEPVQAQSVIVNPGERYDVIIHANQTTDNYWIRSQTLQVGMNITANAILRYEGASEDSEPRSTPTPCTADQPCRVVNCPFMYYPKDTNTVCYNVDRLRSPTAQELNVTSDEPVREYFMNFAFPGKTETPGSVNGRAFVNHQTTPLVSYRPGAHSQQGALTCSRDDCGEDKVCHCPYTFTLEQNALHQMTFLNLGSGLGWDHPIHMHGHTFQVVKVGWGTYNKTTGEFLYANDDIDCGKGPGSNEQSFCNNASWANKAWANGNVPGLELQHPVLKDTVIVPSGGYVVIRVRADNPGLWIIHCHVELHLTDGMAALLNESYPAWPDPPANFPTCHNYYGAE